MCLLLGDRLNPDFLTAAENAFAQFAIPFACLEADFTEFGSLPTGFYLSRATYGRLSIPEEAARFAPRTLYLDADCLVVGDIAPLGGIDLSGAYVAAAARSRWHSTLASPGGVVDWAERGFDPSSPFFNAGVLVIDNEAWVNKEISLNVIADLRRSPETATFADQGTLNAVLYNQWLELPQHWNHQVVRTPAIRVGPLVVSRHDCFSLQRVRIFHYLTDVKPWDARYPPGYLSAIYCRNWERFLPTRSPLVQTYWQWLRKRLSS